MLHMGVNRPVHVVGAQNPGQWEPLRHVPGDPACANKQWNAWPTWTIRAFQRTSPRRRIPHDIAVRAHRNRELLLVIHRRRIVHFDTGQPRIRTVECRFVDVGDLHQTRAQGDHV